MLDYIPGIEQLYFLITQLSHYLSSATVFFTTTLAALQIPAPVGALGVWRWGVWLFRRTVGLFYRPLPPNNYRATTSVITPVYNETLLVFRAALRSWVANRPTEIIAVIDKSDEKCIEEFRKFEKDCEAIPGVTPRMIITDKPGKRPALVDGMLAANGDIICLVDSDTIWAHDVLQNVVAPFIDPKVGGVTTRQNVLWPTSTSQRLFDVYLDIRYEDEIRFLTAFADTPFGDAVTCLSGRTAVYRRSAVLPVLDGLVNETFMGKKVISGDDKALTLLVQGQGWKVRYQESAVVYTPGAEEMRTFLKQRLRWARNSWRADLKAVSSRWAWRKPLLAVHLIDRLLQPLTTLVAPLYVGYAVFQQHWLAVLVVVTWWFLSRTIKIWPHLRRGRSSLAILPWYVGFNYWSAVMRIYAFFTMNQQGWITRWNQNRMALLGPLRILPAYLATALTIALVGAGVVYKGSLNAASLATPPVSTVAHNITAPTDNLLVSAPRTEQAKAPAKPVAAQVVNAVVDQDLVYSGDGQYIAFVYKQADRALLVIRDVTTQKLHQLAIAGEFQSAPVWSPDNEKIAVMVKHNQVLAVATVNIATKEQLIWRPAQDQANFDGFVWSTDSNSIILHVLLDNSPLPAEQESPRFIAQMAIDLGLTQAP